MKSRSLIACILSVLTLIPAAAQEKVRVALADIQIQTTQPQLAFVGKGITELIAVELAKSKNVTLVEREKRTALLEEMEFGMSGMADPSKAAEIGRLLTADYLVFGEAFDMAGTFVFSLKLVKVESGEVVWADKLSENLAKYDYVAGFFAKSLLKSLNAKAASTTVAKAETAEAKSEEALVAFSKAVEAVDKQDKTAARKELKKAKELDPESDAVKYYLSKLAGSSPRGQIEVDVLSMSYNPALAAFQEKPQVYTWWSAPSLSRLAESSQTDVGDYLYSEKSGTLRLGVLFPLGTGLGLSAEAQMSTNISNTDVDGAFTLDPDGANSVSFDRSSFGGSLGFGAKIGETIGLGLAVRAGYNAKPAGTGADYWYGIKDNRSFSLAVEGGFLYRGPDEKLTADFRLLWSLDSTAYIDAVDQAVVFGDWPLTLNAGATLGMLDRSLFVSCRAIGEIYYDDRAGYVLRIVPSVEWWPTEWLSLRAGGEFSSLSLLGISNIGWGGLGGISAKFGRFAADINVAYRYLPYRGFPGEGVYEDRYLIGLTYSF